MTTRLRWESEGLLLRLDKGAQRLQYAQAYAANATALHVQRAGFAHVGRSVNIRKAPFFYGTASRPGGVAGKIRKAIPRNGDTFAEVQVGREAAPDQSRSVILAKLEEGGTRRDPKGGLVAIPITGGARPNMGAPVDKALSFSKLRITAYKGTKKVRRGGRTNSVERGFGTGGQSFRPEFALPGVRWLGRLGTWFARTPGAPLGAVYQRQVAAVRMLWKYQTQVPVPDRLDYVRVARETWRKHYREEFEKQAIASLTHHGFRFVA